VPYSPVGRGFLTGTVRSVDDLADNDFRRALPQFQPGNFERNLELADRIAAISGSIGATPVQVALAWLLAQGEDLVPIPGTKRVRYLEENAGAAAVTLSDEVIAEINAAVPGDAVAGERYSAAGLAAVGL